MKDKDFRVFKKIRCSGKSSYTKKLAETLKNRMWETKSVQLRIYQCQNCNFWHLTHNIPDNNFKKGRK